MVSESMTSVARARRAVTLSSHPPRPSCPSGREEDGERSETDTERKEEGKDRSDVSLRLTVPSVSFYTTERHLMSLNKPLK